MAATSLATHVGVAPACRALGVPRATFYRRQRSARGRQQPRKTPARALDAAERGHVLDVLAYARFVDHSPAEVVATLLNEGQYLCSERTMYRILGAEQPVRERRNQLTHPRYAKPQHVATAPNRTWSWDVTGLLGPNRSMSGRLRHMWPEGIAGRLGLLLLAGFGMFAIVTGLLYLNERREQMAEVFARTLSVRTVETVVLLEEAPLAMRRRMQTVLSDRRLRVRLLAGLPQEEEWQPPERIDADVARYLEPLRPRRVLMWSGEQSVDSRGRPRLLVAVALEGGAWAEFTIRAPRRWPRPGAFFWLGLAALLVVLALMWGAHRMTRPLRRFAEAADRLGLDAAPPPLPEQGPRELRQATRAFNRMTARIRRLVDDRTLLLAAVTHDLRTMLTRLRLRAEFIEDREQREKATSDLHEMQTMLDATLTFARDEASDEHPVPVDLAALLRSLVADLAGSGHEASLNGPDRLTLAGRPVALRRLFENLLDNALRYGDEATATLMRVDGRAEVLVDDRGPGIPETLRERVFDPFFRLEPSRSRDTGGSGLGLAVVRAVVQRHDGTIELEDRPGGGLRVRITLPLDLASSVPGAP